MDIKATLETRQSKTGKSYDVVVLKLSDKSEKLVFLTPSERELLQIFHEKNSNDSDSSSFPFSR